LSEVTNDDSKVASLFNTNRQYIQQKQEAGEVARQDHHPGTFTSVPDENTHIAAAPYTRARVLTIKGDLAQ